MQKKWNIIRPKFHHARLPSYVYAMQQVLTHLDCVNLLLWYEKVVKLKKTEMRKNLDSKRDWTEQWQTAVLNMPSWELQVQFLNDDRTIICYLYSQRINANERNNAVCTPISSTFAHSFPYLCSLRSHSNTSSVLRDPAQTQSPGQRIDKVAPG